MLLGFTSSAYPHFDFPDRKKNHSYSDTRNLNSLFHWQNLLYFIISMSSSIFSLFATNLFREQLMRFDHNVILRGHSSIMLSGSYYISEPLRRTQPNKAAVEGDYIVVVNISGVKSKEGKKLLRLKSSVDAGTYGDSLSADKFQWKIRRQFLNSEIQKLTPLQVVGIKKNLITIRSCLKSLEINDLLLYVIFCLDLETKEAFSSLAHMALEYKSLIKPSI